MGIILKGKNMTKKAFLNLLAAAAITQPLQAMNYENTFFLTLTSLAVAYGSRSAHSERQRKLNLDLSSAGYYQQFEKAQALIKDGADFNSRDHDQTTLYWAIYHGNENMAIWLIDNGARLEGLSSDEERENALNFAIQQRELNIVTHLIKNGAKPDLKNQCTFEMCASLGMIDLAQQFLEKNPGLINVDTGGPALHKAIFYERTEVINYLLNAGADINALDARRWTPLHCAVYYQNFDAVKLLVNRGADIKAVNNFNQTPTKLALQEYPNSPITYYLKNEHNSRALVQTSIHANTTTKPVPFNDALIFCKK